METGADVGKILFDFLQDGIKQAIFMPPQKELRKITIAPITQTKVFHLIESVDEITLEMLCELEQDEKECLSSLLLQYVMILGVNPNIAFPDDITNGSGCGRIGKGILNYIAEHRWPFPQLFSNGKLS